ncbi:exonuclease SbcCD subunit D (plasmid) [Streptomyces sp. NBC_01343]|uniref:exonuclease SbcCD subunit D n=1 Tax=Streptomyces sp. NBC_01343 TaxID=2903832 RepID=UPI002E13BFE4|nr:exonuclease SbcCD subunit D [Streptomyces sp. NBC_01343]WSI28596.1 exonuclease SbcCD subunit D [Streptomyces sp. NBC_01343]WSI29136.1 exonuclease SbcCD subunit D [Streptomyces sp. NBC_01343]WSI29635.1 exonuclease SbcCD subunit D [Streptomyces sp. NBC_01343]
MRLLHTSDWHLGRTFYRESLIGAQRSFLDHLLTVVREREVDAVLVAGDIYDRAIPSLDAVALYDHALNSLADLRVPAVMISGNHDSPQRLGVTSRLIERAGIHLRTDPATCHTPAILHDAHGPVAFYGLPYLEPLLTREELAADRPTHEAVLGAAMDRVRADLTTRPAGTRSVVLAHAFVTGGHTSDSERDITAGGIPTVTATVFDGIDYVALGHLHRPQKVTDRIRYSGSPLAYSFSEAGYAKTTWLVDLDADADLTAEAIPCPRPQILDTLTGRLDALLKDHRYAHLHDAWLHITLTDPQRPINAMDRLRTRFPHTVQLTFAPENDGSHDTATYTERTRHRTALEITVGFVGHVRGGHAPTPAEHALLRQAVEATRLNDNAKETR